MGGWPSEQDQGSPQHCKGRPHERGQGKNRQCEGARRCHRCNETTIRGLKGTIPVKMLLCPALGSKLHQETAHLEAQAYELEQKTALAAEAKSVLDSWVRYEGQVKERQQKELAESIINKITKELENPKTLQQILNQSVADVESKFACECLRPSR